MSYRFESLDYPRPSGVSTRTTPSSCPWRSTRRLHTNAGAEFIYTLNGTLNVHIEAGEHALSPATRCTSIPGFRMGIVAAAPQECCAILATTA